MKLQLLQQKLPEIRGWIERTLATHQPFARTTASYGLLRLAQYYSADLLNGSHVVEVSGPVPVPPLGDMGLSQFVEFESGIFCGITYLNTYFVHAASATDESLHFHELVHVVQWHHLGVERFLMAYALGYLQASCYRKNPLEVMAYDFQKLFEQGGQLIDLESSVRQRLDALIPSLLNQNLRGKM